MPASPGERLNAARRRQFVGRAAEPGVFQAALSAADLPSQIMFVVGPGGMGKTALLHEFKRLSEAAQARPFYLDARTIEPVPEAFVGALRSLMSPNAAVSPLDVLGCEADRKIILVDTAEIL